MPLTTALLAWLRALFARPQGRGLIALVVAFVLVGWVVAVLALMVTGVADGLGRVGATRSLSSRVRVGSGVAVVLAMGMVASLPDMPRPVAIAESPAIPSPTTLAVVVPTLAPTTPSPTATLMPTSAPTDPCEIPRHCVCN